MKKNRKGFWNRQGVKTQSKISCIHTQTPVHEAKFLLKLTPIIKNNSENYLSHCVGFLGLLSK